MKQGKRQYEITTQHYFNGDPRHTTTSRVTSVHSFRRRVLSRMPRSIGWGSRHAMTREAAEALGAYETESGQWVIHAPEFDAFVEISERGRCVRRTE